MHRYFIKTPWLVRKLFPEYIWRMRQDEKAVYLTFDDGPHPEITPWVLDLLAAHSAKASFFCIGQNVADHPAVYRRILDEGHAVGNHSFSHPNGWKTGVKEYLADIEKAAPLINSSLFRPPYGRIRKKQAAGLAGAMKIDRPNIIMWDVLSADFDPAFSREQCLENVLANYENGSIIVFHDSEKAFPNLEYVLPLVLEKLMEENYECRKILL